MILEKDFFSGCMAKVRLILQSYLCRIYHSAYCCCMHSILLELWLRMIWMAREVEPWQIGDAFTLDSKNVQAILTL
jgi:hypothetical protein